jgi:hypothetical protein
LKNAASLIGRERLDDIYNIKTPGAKAYKIVLEESALRQAFSGRLGKGFEMQDLESQKREEAGWPCPALKTLPLLSITHFSV